MIRSMFKEMSSNTSTTVDKVKSIVQAAEDIVDNAKIVLESVIDLSDAFGARRNSKERTSFTSSFDKKGPFSTSSKSTPFGGDRPLKFDTRKSLFSSDRIISVDEVSTVADVIDYVSAKTDTPITYGVKTISEEDTAFILSPNIYILTNKHDEITLHFNIDAPAVLVKKSNVERVIDAFTALVNFVIACIEFTQMNGVVSRFENGSLYIKLNDIEVNAGLVILMIKALMDSDAEEGFTFNVSDYRCKVNRGDVLISKDGYSPASIPVEVFEELHESVTVFSDIELSDRDFIQYSDNPNELFVRMVVELMNSHDIDINTEDLKIIDNVILSSLRTNTLGNEIKKNRK